MGKLPEQMLPRGKRGVWYANCRYLGVFIRDCLNTTDRRLAERRLAEIKFAVERGDYQKWRLTFDEVADEYAKTVLPGKSKQAQVRYGQIVRLHVLPFFTGRKIAELNELEIYKYLQSRNDANIPADSIKKERRVLRDIMRLAVKDFKLPDVQFRNKGKMVDRFLSEDDLNAIVGNLEDKYKPVAITAAYTGLRLGNVIRLGWREIDMSSGMISVRQAKTGNPVKVPIAGRLMDVLKASARFRVLGEDRVSPGITKQAFQKAWRRAKVKAGFEWARPHDMRHFFCSFLLNAGVDHLVVAELAGHKSVAMLKARYGHISEKTLKTAISVFDGGCTQTVHKFSFTK